MSVAKEIAVLASVLAVIALIVLGIGAVNQASISGVYCGTMPNGTELTIRIDGNTADVIWKAGVLEKKETYDVRLSASFGGTRESGYVDPYDQDTDVYIQFFENDALKIAGYIVDGKEIQFSEYSLYKQK